MAVSAPITHVHAQALRFPTDAPEADGTICWRSTTMVMATVEAAGATGLGYTYADEAAASLINRVLAGRIAGKAAANIPQHWTAMVSAVRNIGWRGIAACAISAVDVALWDLKARLLNVSLAALLGSAREHVPIYGSGGFTSYDDDRLARQFEDFVHRDGCRFVKMKVGSEPERDVGRVAVARKAAETAALFVDANGAYSRKQALTLAQQFDEYAVAWFEEPVSSDDLEGLRLIRDHAPARMDIAAGEYGYEPFYLRRMLEAGAVDVLQADATRCGGYTGFLRAAALADAHGLPLSSHCAPALHLPVCCAAPRVRHMEWFHDHVRIEQKVFDGAPQSQDGTIVPDKSRPGHGLIFKSRDAERLAA
jgi:L-alanine-DL-glutamate epimerase-like enolase superfamily enzyme